MLRDTGTHRTSAAVHVSAGRQEPETLTEVAQRLRRHLQQGAVAEGQVATEVMRLAGRWDKLKADAKGLEIGPWLRKYVGRRPLAWYSRRADAAARCKRYGLHDCLDSAAACWWAAQVPEEAAKQTAETIRAYWRSSKNNRIALNCGAVSKLCHGFVQARRSALAADVEAKELEQLRARIERLEAQVRRLGEEPVE